jgi:hypothetical protein
MTETARSRIVTLVILATIIVLGLWVLVTPFISRVPRSGPSVEVVTTRCLGPDGRPVGEEFGQPCPSGTTTDTVVIESYLPTAQP